MTSIFIDTGYVIALEAADDQFHNIAAHHWHDFSTQLPPLVTTSYVFDEIVTFFNSRNQHAKAVEIGDRLIRSAAIQLMPVDEGLFYDGWRYFIQHDDKSYSLTDCVSFLVMERLGVRTALTFDHHFVQAGFEKLP